jgi:hypothetical protein
LIAASATLALKSGEWFRRVRFVISSPDWRRSSPRSGRSSTYRTVQILRATSELIGRHRETKTLLTGAAFQQPAQGASNIQRLSLAIPTASTVIPGGDGLASVSAEQVNPRRLRIIGTSRRLGARRMIRRRGAAVGIFVPIGNHSFRATGITAYLSNGGSLEHAHEMAAHESPRTTSRRVQTAQTSEGHPSKNPQNRDQGQERGAGGGAGGIPQHGKALLRFIPHLIHLLASGRTRVISVCQPPIGIGRDSLTCRVAFRLARRDPLRTRKSPI